MRNTVLSKKTSSAIGAKATHAMLLHVKHESLRHALLVAVLVAPEHATCNATNHQGGAIRSSNQQNRLCTPSLLQVVCTGIQHNKKWHFACGDTLKDVVARASPVLATDDTRC